ncbi:MAG: SDR family oxidoreductase [Alphaproteobacteria bacterium]|nr:SDR family oxidoreductase [Alphaproteobacteria bacterium]
MDLQLSDKVIFIAGASRGIGLGIAETCLREGARVGLVARQQGPLDESTTRLASQYGRDRVWSRTGDMRSSRDVEAALSACEAEFGPIWGAVANVGIHPCPAGFDVDDETWAQGLDQNLGSSFRVARGALSRMTPRQEGAIVLISSIAGMRAMGSPLTYGTAKAAVNHLAAELARIAGKTNIRVNALAPGNIIFPDGEWERRMNGPRREAWERWVKREAPLQRFGTPEEIGAVVAFLMSPCASFVTGAMIAVDGGQSA